MKSYQSPDVSRYKEFYKNGAVKLYMPTWTLPELQDVRKFAADRMKEQMPLTQEDISERFHEFGGIFRHVFSPELDRVREEQKRAIEDLDPSEFDRGRREVNHLVAQYRVDTEVSDAFKRAHIDIVSRSVRQAVEAQFFKSDLKDKIRLLRKNDESPSYMASMSRSICEEVIAKQLHQGVHWQKKNLIDSHFSEFKLKLKIVERKPPVFDDMEPGVLYKSFEENYPAVEMMFKTEEEGTLYGLQVTRLQDVTRKIKTSAVDQWLKGMGFKDNKDKVRIAVIPKPALAEKFKVVYEGNGAGYPQLEVWKMPLDYSQQF